ncbi:hypothetical protein C8D94_101492 [Marinirhabdus gelatinilytica]|uniref:Uncharacterized protein n=2 Tax=Marinirhabdus gelatinilytica TaxID=1703343 RepID=A0A370QJS4_9FLAO|nr:hypothetical protein C8D94_101492 [Marinirhabdus gelatinilytica]
MVQFFKRESTKVLQFISKNGHYKNRIHISENISELSIPAQIKIVDILLDDPIQIISMNAIKIGKYLLQSKTIREKAFDKEIFWETRDAELLIKQKRIAHILKGSTNHKRKFGDGESLKNVKQMLKRNLHGGKWF